MNDIAGVHEVHGAGELVEDMEDLVKGEGTAFFSFVKEGAAFEPFHRHIGAKAAEMAEVMDGDDIVVLEASKDTGFAFKASFGFFVGDEVSAQDFDGEELSEVGVSALVDSACAAKADAFFEDDLSDIFAEEGVDVFAFEGGATTAAVGGCVVVFVATISASGALIGHRRSFLFFGGRGQDIRVSSRAIVGHRSPIWQEGSLYHKVSARTKFVCLG